MAAWVFKKKWQEDEWWLGRLILNSICFTVELIWYQSTSPMCEGEVSCFLFSFCNHCFISHTWFACRLNSAEFSFFFSEPFTHAVHHVIYLICFFAPSIHNKRSSHNVSHWCHSEREEGSSGRNHASLHNGPYNDVFKRRQTTFVFCLLSLFWKI